MKDWRVGNIYPDCTILSKGLRPVYVTLLIVLSFRPNICVRQYFHDVQLAYFPWVTDRLVANLKKLI